MVEVARDLRGSNASSTCSVEDKRGNSRYKRVIERVTIYRRGNPGVEKISARSTLPLPVKTKSTVHALL